MAAPILIDANLTLNGEFDVMEFPCFVIIGKGGVIKWIHEGLDSDTLEEMNKAIIGLLKNK